MLSTEVINLLL